MSRPIRSVLARTLLGPLTLCIQIFALYVLVHGHLSPGGGFQAGVLMGAGAILAALVAGRHAIPKPWTAVVLAVAGLAVYAGLGVLAPLVGRPYLDYGSLPIPAEEPLRRYAGILGIEIGVTLTVAGAIILLFHTLTQNLEQP
ncbi:MAG: MnhB domain-containing protein [Planctomycetota bacterium]